MNKIDLAQVYNKTKCMFGFHDWETIPWDEKYFKLKERHDSLFRSTDRGWKEKPYVEPNNSICINCGKIMLFENIALEERIKRYQEIEDRNTDIVAKKILRRERALELLRKNEDNK